MNKRLFRSTCFVIAAVAGVGLATIAGAQELEPQALSRAGWSLTANQIHIDERDESVRLRGDVLLSRGAWRVSAASAEVSHEAISVSGAVRLVGPAVYVMSASAIIRGEEIEAVDGYLAAQDVQLGAQRVVVSTDDATIQLFGVGSSREQAGREPAEANGTRRTSAP